MKIGTKSVLYGAHCFFLHPFFVLAGWITLFGWPWDPRIWIAIVVHDLGYIGKPNIDGPEGETHVELAGRIMHMLFDWRRIGTFHTIEGGRVRRITLYEDHWGNFSRYHSRYYAKQQGNPFSRLCLADKMAIVLEPWWMYLPRVNFTGEIREYMELAEKRNLSGEHLDRYQASRKTQREWYGSVQKYVRAWVEEHKDMKPDTWTPGTKTAADDQ